MSRTPGIASVASKYTAVACAIAEGIEYLLKGEPSRTLPGAFPAIDRLFAKAHFDFEREGFPSLGRNGEARTHVLETAYAQELILDCYAEVTGVRPDNRREQERAVRELATYAHSLEGLKEIAPVVRKDYEMLLGVCRRIMYKGEIDHATRIHGGKPRYGSEKPDDDD